MGSSKFSSPFFKKSPLLGAYSSGADGIVTVSDLPHYQKLQQDLVAGTLATFTPEAIDDDMQKTIDKREAREKAGGSKLKKFLDKNKLDFLTANYTKDSNEDGTSDYKDKTAEKKAKLKKRQDERATTTQEKLANNCIRKSGSNYIGYDPDLNNGKGGCY